MSDQTTPAPGAALDPAAQYAADTGFDRGYIYEHAQAHPDTYPAIPVNVTDVPEQFAAHATAYRDAFEKGRAAYLADQKQPPPAPQAV